MKVTRTKSPNKQAEKRRKRKGKKGSTSTTRKPREDVGSQVAASPVPILRRTDLPEAETVKKHPRN